MRYSAASGERGEENDEEVQKQPSPLQSSPVSQSLPTLLWTRRASLNRSGRPPSGHE